MNILEKQSNIKITTSPEDINLGLFGGIILFIFEILPYLHSKSVYPAWDIKSQNYGMEPSFTILPGVFDLAYDLDSDLLYEKEIKLTKIHKNHACALGSEWNFLNNLWNQYFKVPSRINAAADEAGDLTNVLGIHYRGTDKIKTPWDTNPVNQDEFILLIKDFLKKNKEVKKVFIATDEFSFVEKFKQDLPTICVVNLGETEPHLKPAVYENKADRALLDCLLLSRCRYMINTSSALSSFAKILNPSLECYRVAASKLFADIPYFPTAYLPKLETNDFECKQILEKFFQDDWIENKQLEDKYRIPFATYIREKRKDPPFGFNNFYHLLKNKLIRIIRM